MDRDERFGLDAQKKTIFARERETSRVQELRAEYKAHLGELDIDHLVFIDESGLRLGSSNRYGWAPRGEGAYGYEPHRTWETMTMIGAMSVSGLRGFMTVDAATSGDVFAAYVESELAPNLQVGDVVVMDNLAAHKNQMAREAIEDRGARILFLPPYSPDLNPIEMLWAKLKALVRRCETLTRDTFDQAVASALSCITVSDLEAWAAHCGYASSPA